jgi:hypothetical protein
MFVMCGIEIASSYSAMTLGNRQTTRFSSYWWEATRKKFPKAVAEMSRLRNLPDTMDAPEAPQ